MLLRAAVRPVQQEVGRMQPLAASLTSLPSAPSPPLACSHFDCPVCRTALLAFFLTDEGKTLNVPNT
mgnify:CR=1 FL=1